MNDFVLDREQLIRAFVEGEEVYKLLLDLDIEKLLYENLLLSIVERVKREVSINSNEICLSYYDLHLSKIVDNNVLPTWLKYDYKIDKTIFNMLKGKIILGLYNMGLEPYIKNSDYIAIEISDLKRYCGSNDLRVLM